MIPKNKAFQYINQFINASNNVLKIWLVSNKLWSKNTTIHNAFDSS